MAGLFDDLIPQQAAPALSPDLLASVKKSEGFAPVAAWDYRQNTNGYGTRAQQPGERIDQATADARLQQELGSAAGIVDRFAPNLPPGVRNALISLTFNAGDQWTRSGLGERIKAGDLAGARDRFLQYTKAGGQDLPGLVARRQREAAWFDAPGDSGSSAALMAFADEPQQAASGPFAGIDRRRQAPQPANGPAPRIEMVKASSAGLFDDLIPQQGAADKQAPSGAGLFDDLIPQKSQRSGVAMNALAGLNDGIYGTLGAPVDAATWLVNQGIRGVNAVAGSDLPQIKEPVGGSKSISKAFGAVGVPEPETVQATTTGEKIARGAGQGAGYTIAPEAALAGLGRAGLANVAPKVAEAAGQAFGRAASPGAVATNAAIGSASGAGSTAAMDAVPDPWKPYAGLAGGLGAVVLPPWVRWCRRASARLAASWATIWHRSPPRGRSAPRPASSATRPATRLRSERRWPICRTTSCPAPSRPPFR